MEKRLNFRMICPTLGASKHRQLVDLTMRVDKPKYGMGQSIDASQQFFIGFRKMLF